MLELYAVVTNFPQERFTFFGENGVPDENGIANDLARVLMAIWRSGGKNCGFNAVAMNVGEFPTSMRRKTGHFITASIAGTKCGNGTN